VPNGLILEDLPGGSFTDLGLLAEPIRVETASWLLRAVQATCSTRRRVAATK
jgi:hypothetical protein